MVLLEEIKVGSSVCGIAGERPVTVCGASFCGDNALEVTYKDDTGQLGECILFRSHEADLTMFSPSGIWSFTADADKVRLVSEAKRIRLAHLFDPYLAIHSSLVEPLPHQISAVYEEMLPRLPLRYLLADDPGAGKTIMTGLLIKELIIRGDLKRCLIVTPGSLSEQWQDELRQKFGLSFTLLTNENIESAASGNVFTEIGLCIARLDKLSRSDDLQAKLLATDWDLIVVDEAHKMSATVWGNEVKRTRRFDLGLMLSSITRNFLLLTATPHNGKEKDFQLFLSLLDRDRFEGSAHSSPQPADVSDVMRRLVKEELLKFDGTQLFPERIAYTVNYDLSPEEAELYESVTNYVRQQFNRADTLDGTRKSAVGFALTILQRRLASSPEAIYQSLQRRRERMEARLRDEKLGINSFSNAACEEIPEDLDDLTSDELEKTEETAVDQVSASKTINELEAEIETLKSLENAANKVRLSGHDRKWDELSKLLQQNAQLFAPEGGQEKLIIFTEHRDTLRYLTGKIRSLLGSEESVITIHGGMGRQERRKAEELFKQDKGARILIATDAAGEGINLQRAHLMVNYDLPWNPNRLEQRFGRIHRIGQTRICHLWNLVSAQTREGAVFDRLFKKLEEERSALGGRVFDILGKVTFNNKPLRELLIEAIRYGENDDNKARMNSAVDRSLDREALKKLLEERALSDSIMNMSRVSAIRENMERMEARRLQPYFIESFFLKAFAEEKGAIHKRENNRYEITAVPAALRSRDREIRAGAPLLRRYDRVCFDKKYISSPGKPDAELLCPGHPLLDALIDVTMERYSALLKKGTVFIDETSSDDEARLLFYVEDSIQDGTLLSNGAKRVVSKEMRFIELKENGAAASAGYAPYLDYRSPKPEELDAVRKYTNSQNWLASEIEKKARGYAVSSLIPEYLEEVKSRREQRIIRIESQIKQRLVREINYWDVRAVELKEKEAAGKGSTFLNSSKASERAENLDLRLKKRLAELAAERQISALPPIISVGALVIPARLLAGTAERIENIGPVETKEIEAAAMETVMEIERELGNCPKDVSADKCGYDIESEIPEEKRKGGSALRFIEVKGKCVGSASVIVTKNEILTSLNKPDEFILAVVEIDCKTRTTDYLQNPFRTVPDFTSTAVIYDRKELIENSQILLHRETDR